MEPVAAVATPDTDVPRTLRRKPGRVGLWSALFVLVIPHFWVGLGLIVVGLCALSFPFVATRVDGRVESKSTGHNKNGPTWSIYVAYTLDGRPSHASKAVNPAQYDATHEGDVVRLRAARFFGTFDATQFDGEIPLFLPVVFFATFWNAIVGVFVWLLAIRPFFSWWLVRNGRRARAVIVEHRHVGGKGAHEDVVVRFTPADGGEPIQKKLNVQTRAWQASGLAAGAHADVFHHPTRPTLCTLYATLAWQIV